MEIEKEKDLKELIDNKIEESTSLEYKSLDSLKNNSEIAKDISAMANSEGGTIVYGITEDDKGFPGKIEWTSDKKLKDKIDQVLFSQINRKIEGCEIKEIHSDRDKKRFVIVVIIPKSELAPHQAGNKKYYRRSNSRVREMEHGEIEDLFFIRKRPKLEIELRRCPTRNPSYDIIVFNRGKVLAEKIFIKLLIPSVFKISNPTWPKIRDLFTLKGHGCSEYHFVNHDEFIYPELPNKMGKLFHPKNHYVESLKIGFLVVCKDMEIKRGTIIVGDGKKTEVIYTKDQGTPFPEWELKHGSYSIF